MLDNTALMAALLGRGSVTPLTLFGSRLMFWYDPSDVSSLYQGTDTSTPVAALNDPIGRINDKSGKGNHATQGNASFKPLWKQDGNNCYNALFDATDDCLFTSAIDFTASDKIAVFAAVRKLSDATVGIIAELSANSGANSGTFGLFAPSGAAAATYSFRSRGTGEGVPVTPTSYASPVTSVLTCLGDISADSAIIRVNGSQVATAATDQGSGTFGNHVLNVGRRNNSTNPLNGQIYQLFGVLGSVTAAEITAAETYLNTKSLAF